jgi:hypothetical protein
MTEIEKYILNLDNLDLSGLLESWIWLTGVKTIVALTKAGDVLFKDRNNELYFLDTGIGEMKLISHNYLDFFQNQLSEKVMDELLMPDLVDNLQRKYTNLKPGQVYSYNLLPILGGLYDEINMFPLDIYEHFGLTGEIHNKIRNMPDGTGIKIEFEK